MANQNVLESKIFTYELIDDQLIINEDMGVKQVSIYNSSSVVGTVLGSLSLGGIASMPINLGEGDIFTVQAIEASVIKNLTIDAPSGCTLKIVAQQ